MSTDIVTLPNRPVVAAVVLHEGLFRDGVERILSDRGFSVRYSVSLVRDLLAKLHDNAPPDVVVLLGALSLSPDEMRALRTVRDAAPKAGIIVLAEEDSESALLEQVVSMGVVALLPIDLSAEVLVEAIQLVLLGEGFMCVEFIQRLLAGSERIARLQSPNLTKQEVDIIRLVAKGCSNKTIADWLNSTEAAVKGQVRRLLRKLGAANRTQAAIWAMQTGLLAKAEHSSE